MIWNRWYAFKSYILSALWLAPLIAIALSQVTFWGRARWESISE